MRILVTESTAGAATGVQQELRAAGYEVVGCRGTASVGDDCVVFERTGDCPLHVSPVDLVIDVRPEGGPETARELGAACAVRSGVPLVVVGLADADRYPWSEAAVVCTEADVLKACEAVLSPVDATVARVAARAAQLSLLSWGVHGQATVSIAEAAGDTAVFVSVPVPLSDSVRQDVTDAVRHAVSGRRGFAEDPRIIVDCGSV